MLGHPATTTCLVPVAPFGTMDHVRRHPWPGGPLIVEDGGYLTGPSVIPGLQGPRGRRTSGHGPHPPEREGPGARGGLIGYFWVGESVTDGWSGVVDIMGAYLRHSRIRSVMSRVCVYSGCRSNIWARILSSTLLTCSSQPPIPQVSLEAFLR